MTESTTPAVQDRFPSTCFGCGADNAHGLQIKTHLEGDEGICIWTPRPEHNAGGPMVYGGVIASIIDCHCSCTAQALTQPDPDQNPGQPRNFFVTRTLTIEYLKPTPLEVPLTLRARIDSQDGRKVHLSCDLYAQDTLTVTGKGLFIEIQGD